MKNLLKYLYPYVKPYWKISLVALFLAIPFSAIKGVQVWLVKYVVNTLTPEAQFDDALLMSLSLLGLALINYPCRYYHFYLMRYVIDLAACDIREELYRKIQNLPLSFFVATKSGNLISSLLNDTRMLADGLKNLIDAFREPLTALIMLVMALYSDWQLTLVILVVAPLFILIFVKSGKKVRHNQEIVQEELARMTHSISEGIGGQKITKAFNLQNYVRKRFLIVQEAFFKFQMKTAAVEENAHPLVELVGALAFAGVIVFAQYRIRIGAMTTGDFFSFVTALALMMDPLRKYSQANVKINQARAAGERLMKLLHLEEESDEGKIKLKEFKESIEFKNVTFFYNEDEGEIIKNFSLTIKKGERVGVVGLSGAGKSTLVSLLLRLYPLEKETSKGEILIDGIPISSYTLTSLRSIFGLVSQDIFLFHDTVLENICVGKKYSQSEIDHAVSLAGASLFIDELPKKLETIIGDRGTRLSGGQCQRLTIARAVLRNPPIFLFDEATSALDNASEKAVQEALDRLSQMGDHQSKKSVIAIAHRLSTIKDYDQIVVMKQGEIIEKGKHSELISRKGEYFKLYDLSLSSN